MFHNSSCRSLHMLLPSVLCLAGVKSMALWTKRSLKSKPFSLATSKDWSPRPNKVDLRSVFTKVFWSINRQKLSGVDRKYFDDIEQMLREISFGEDDSRRVVIQGAVL